MTLLSKRLILALIIAPLLIASGCARQDGDSFTDKVRKAAEEAAYTGPALWRVSDDDTNVYLFGTVHTLRPETRWQTEAMIAALEEADALYLEADVSSTKAQNDAAKVITELGLLSDGSTLRDILPEDAETEVQEAAEILGVPLQGLDNLQPWYASFALSDIHLEKLGFDRSSGVEDVLSKRASRLAIPSRYLETGAEQLTIVASIPINEQILMLQQTAEQIEDDPEFLDRMIAEWAEGDVDALGTLISSDEVFGSGAVYDLLLKKRNQNWTSQIERLMEAEAGTFFIAVGAAHLAGEDSVQSMLRAEGLSVVRENPRPVED